MPAGTWQIHHTFPLSTSSPLCSHNAYVMMFLLLLHRCFVDTWIFQVVQPPYDAAQVPFVSLTWTLGEHCNAAYQCFLPPALWFLALLTCWFTILYLCWLLCRSLRCMSKCQLDTSTWTSDSLKVIMPQMDLFLSNSHLPSLFYCLAQKMEGNSPSNSSQNPRVMLNFFLF